MAVESYPTGERGEVAYWRTLIADTSNDGERINPDDGRSGFLYRQWRNTFRRAESGFFSVADDFAKMLGGPRSGAIALLCGIEDQDFKEFHTRVLSATTGNRFVITENGYMGLVPSQAKVGDRICVLHGGATPFVLRNESQGYRLIEACFVHGIMDGETIKNGVSSPQEIHIF
jgi:hypothetical protein